MNLVQQAVSRGGKLAPLLLPAEITNGTGLMNPSIFIDDDGDILVNLRHVNYTLYHSENNQMFPSKWGPLSYLHPENDMVLATTNYLCRLDEDLVMTDYAKVDTSAFDVPPMWEFTGQEDCRVVQWEGQYFLIGVRRDTTTTGVGRMEYSQISLDKQQWTATETRRMRIPAPGDDSSYCEKNWVPILDKPYNFIKWHSPVEQVFANPFEPTIEQVKVEQGIQPPLDQRGGSQLIPWNDGYISITHEVVLFKNYLQLKDGIYRHRLCVWDKDLKLIGLSPKPFSFLEGRIEFCTGLAKQDNDVLISFGFQDNSAFVLKAPASLIEEMKEEALTYGN
jgi:hypothetical protein